VSAFEANETALTTSVAAETLTSGNLFEIAAVRVRRATGEGTQFSQAMTVQATGTDTLTYRLAIDGRVVQVTGNRNTDLVVQLPSIGQSVPAHESSILRMTLLR
jgi:hypothetical protein